MTMHVGNCTDGPADYQLAGDGLIIEPPGASNEDVFILERDKQNLWTITGTKRVIFKVGQAEHSVTGVTNDDIALLIQCGTQLSAVKLQQAPHQER